MFKIPYMIGVMESVLKVLEPGKSPSLYFFSVLSGAEPILSIEDTKKFQNIVLIHFLI